MTDSAESGTTVLILSADATGAALLGALVETFGYDVRFARPPEPIDRAIRRARPKVCLIDCTEPQLCREDVVAHAVMRGVCTVLYGTPDLLAKVRLLAEKFDLDFLMMPIGPAELESALRGALESAEN